MLGAGTAGTTHLRKSLSCTVTPSRGGVRQPRPRTATGHRVAVRGLRSYTFAASCRPMS